ncbi:hypothetical protein [uncultured Vibrio sp.]|uniref:hypothetical protein n=1 Tax=uncultured Vibrio sp. TaxID=114054 RepID=UPI0026001DDD|nr:hypothetical protein [uncultured Vibrio sp.]
MSDLEHLDIPDGLQLVDVSSDVALPPLAITTYTSNESHNPFRQWFIKCAEHCVSELKAK